MVSEILKHPVEKVYYLELDPKIIEISKNYLPQFLKKTLDDSRVQIVFTDGIHFKKIKKNLMQYW